MIDPQTTYLQGMAQQIDVFKIGSILLIIVVIMLIYKWREIKDGNKRKKQSKRTMSRM